MQYKNRIKEWRAMVDFGDIIEKLKDVISSF
jgi:hypothetical protein